MQESVASGLSPACNTSTRCPGGQSGVHGTWTREWDRRLVEAVHLATGELPPGVASHTAADNAQSCPTTAAVLVEIGHHLAAIVSERSGFELATADRDGVNSRPSSPLPHSLLTRRV